jgi:hypothetical protein
MLRKLRRVTNVLSSFFVPCIYPFAFLLRLFPSIIFFESIVSHYVAKLVLFSTVFHKVCSSSILLDTSHFLFYPSIWSLASSTSTRFRRPLVFSGILFQWSVVLIPKNTMLRNVLRIVSSSVVLSSLNTNCFHSECSLSLGYSSLDVRSTSSVPSDDTSEMGEGIHLLYFCPF